MSIETKGKIWEENVNAKGLVWMVMVVGNKPSGKRSPGWTEAFYFLR
jgi:hypothetical protein